MTSSEALTVMRESLMVGVRIAAPILLLSMLIGILISVFQAATQIHEQTLTFVPKLILIAVVLIAGGSWMMESMIDLTTRLFLLMQG